MWIWSCRCSALGPEGSLETSSRPSERQRRTISIRTCCDDVVARPADAEWLTAGADHWKRQTYAHSSPPSTGEHDSGGTNKLWLRAYTEHVDRCPANVAQSGADQTRRGQTSACRWWLMLQHSAHTKPIGNKPRRPSQHGVTIVNMRCNESINKCLCGLDVEGSSNTTNVTEPIEACRTNASNMLLKTKVRWHCDTKETHMVRR